MSAGDTVTPGTYALGDGIVPREPDRQGVIRLITTDENCFGGPLLDGRSGGHRRLVGLALRHRGVFPSDVRGRGDLHRELRREALRDRCILPIGVRARRGGNRRLH